VRNARRDVALGARWCASGRDGLDAGGFWVVLHCCIV
jgi:hypothetical protein